MSTVKQTIELHYYKTNVGLFIRKPSHHYDWHKILKINGKELADIYQGNYLVVEGISEINTVEKLENRKLVPDGYYILDTVPDDLRKHMKEHYTEEEVERYWDEDEDCYRFRNKEFASVATLYTQRLKTIEPSWEDVEIKHNILGELEISDWRMPEKMVVKTIENFNWSAKVKDVDLSSIVCYEDIERMLTPEFLLHKRPCFLTSAQVYKIIRAYVKDNIDGSCAQITSDYDFCFSVSHRVKHAPITTRTELKKANGRSYATPKFTSSTKSHDLVKVFEMTDNEHKYKGYTIIEGWKADNLLEMQEQVKIYLNRLMEEINTEAEKCNCCNGIGYVVNSIKTNSR